MTERSDKPREAPDPAQKKKPYTTPRLEVYGDLKKITKNVGPHGASDNGTPPFVRTRA